MKKHLKAQSGFTLIEMLVALSIVALLALLASNAFDGSRSKAQVMIGLSKQLANANIQLKTDTGCYVNNPRALFDPVAAQETSNNYCNRPFGNTWTRPYLAQYTTDPNGNIVADKIGAGVIISYGREAGGLGQRYYIRFENVPKDVIKQGLLECNGTDATGGDFTNNTCRTGSDLSDTLPGQFDVLYDTTR